MAVVAIRSNRRGWFIAKGTPNPAPSGAGRIETTESLDNAQRFVDQAAIDTLVTANGGVTSDWVALTIP